MRLTAIEIEAVLDAAGNCDVPAMYKDCATDRERERMIEAYERGMEKLRARLDQMRQPITRGSEG